MRRVSRRQLWTEAYKQGYKKALRKLRALKESKDYEPNPSALDSAFQEVEETIAAAVEEARDKGVRDVEGILDHWQQLYADDVLYGDEPLELDELTDAVCHGFERVGIKANWREVSNLLKTYAEL